ncbi:MAG: tetratricopeptide repeat protein [Nitrospira sp.]|nr:tetratricopeptide repeat protein [Nitrospira sp.]
MSPSLRCDVVNRLCTFGLATLGVALLLFACRSPSPTRVLPPSASDLVLLQFGHLCDQKETIVRSQEAVSLQWRAWGSGEEVRVSAEDSRSSAEESYFLDQDGMLVGAVFAFPGGLSLKPYPVLRQTLSQLKPALEFSADVPSVPGRGELESSALYQTGDLKSTTQYIVSGGGEEQTLVLASFSLDPYSRLLSPYRREFLVRVERGRQAKPSRGIVDQQPFLALQQFARGEAAHFASCDTPDDKRAAEAYAQAIQHGFSSQVWLAEAHHKLGLALERTGQIAKARDAIQHALSIRANIPEVLNSLGSVYVKLGDRDKAIVAFEKAVALKPNYSVARYNLASAYETVNVRRAVSEYETYLALVEGIPEEEERATHARQRVEDLSR